MREYQIWLANTLIGTTILEEADVPMGVVFERIVPIIAPFGYDYIKYFYLSRQIGIDFDDANDKMVATSSTTLLRVLTPEGKVIESLGNQIYGMDSDGFKIILEAVPYPFFEDEFPKHCADYRIFFEKTD